MAFEAPGTVGRKAKGKAYWRARLDLLYYQYVYYFCRVVGRDAVSALDVGSRGCPYLDWLTWIERRVSIDLQIPYSSPRVEGIRVDFLSFEPEARYDLTTCLQVLEHVPEAQRFGRKLLDVSRHLVVSVPFNWRGRTPGHVHDPVTLEKLESWMGRAPNYFMIVAEPFVRMNNERLVAYYDVDDPSRRLGPPDRQARRPSGFRPPAVKQPTLS
jgi:hypothetical protein